MSVLFIQTLIMITFMIYCTIIGYDIPLSVLFIQTTDLDVFAASWQAAPCGSSEVDHTPCIAGSNLESNAKDHCYHLTDPNGMLLFSSKPAFPIMHIFFHHCGILLNSISSSLYVPVFHIYLSVNIKICPCNGMLTYAGVNNGYYLLTC